jgi:nucleotide-binding universal stress UspA family protein
MRLLVATDGSNDAKRAVAWVRHLPLPVGHTIMAITVVPRMPAIDGDRTDDLRDALIADARRLADDTASELLRAGVATGRVIDGDPREQIVAAARDWRADLVVVGARGVSGLARFLLGSVSLAVARHAPCPVLICKGAPRDVHAVTVALDGSDDAQHALDWVTTRLSLSPGLRIRLLGAAAAQAIPVSAPGILGTALRAAVGAIDAERRATLEAQLTMAARGLRARWPAMETSVVTGAPAEVIVQDVERRGTDLVVLGARGSGAVSRLLLGSVSEAVVHHATCPVLIVRPQGSDS